jgi:hypothetical protein
MTEEVERSPARDRPNLDERGNLPPFQPFTPAEVAGFFSEMHEKMETENKPETYNDCRIAFAHIHGFYEKLYHAYPKLRT